MRRSILRLAAIALAVIMGLTCLFQTQAQASVEAPRMNLTVRLRRSETPIPNARFSVYRIGDFDDTGAVALDGTIPSSFDVRDVFEQHGWARVSRELAQWAATSGLSPTASGYTGADGCVSFGPEDGIVHGVYLVVGDDVEFEGKVYSSLPFLISMPSFDPEERVWCYEVVASPKPGERVVPDDGGGVVPGGRTVPASGGDGGSSWWPFGPLPKTGDFLVEWGPWLGLGIIVATLGARLRIRERE